jgi:hypothetical protein
VDPVPDPLLLKNSGSAKNRTRDLWICIQELWPLDHRGGPRYCTTRSICKTCILSIDSAKVSRIFYVCSNRLCKEESCIRRTGIITIHNEHTWCDENPYAACSYPQQQQQFFISLWLELRAPTFTFFWQDWLRLSTFVYNRTLSVSDYEYKEELACLWYKRSKKLVDERKPMKIIIKISSLI